jgi:hypothetical protein
MSHVFGAGSRRRFLRDTSVLTAGSALTARLVAAEKSPREKLPVAAVVTIYGRYSHTDVIIGKILDGWNHQGGPGPDLKLVSMYVDQRRSDDLVQKAADRHGFRVTKTIDEAITLGTDRVQVAGVLNIGEHGDYPETPKTKQTIYPRRRFFDEAVAAMKRGGKYVPLFNDKHLAYNWQDAKAMYDTARRLKIPFLAGSSVPLTWRYPTLELDRGTDLEDALTFGYSGLEIYGFHTLEVHQAMIERRKGGESGIKAVQALRGDAIHRAAADGKWSTALLDKAIATLPNSPKMPADWTKQDEAAVFLLEHQDGLKSTVVMCGSAFPEFGFAAKIKGQSEPVATWVRLQNTDPFPHFAHLLHAIEETIHQQKEVYPLERTLLTTGTLDRLMHSVAEEGKRLETPELAIRYEATDYPFGNHPQVNLVLPEPV